MFCGQCGTKNNDTDNFCAGCGAQLTPAPAPAPAPVTPPAKKPNKKLMIGIAVAALVVIVALILIFTLGGKDEANTPEAVVNKYMDAFLNNKPADLLNIIPEAVIEEDIGDKDDRNDWVEMWEDDIEEFNDDMDYYYDKWKISYKIDEVENVDRDALEEIQEYYQEEYSCKVTAAKEVTVELTVSLDGDKETEDMTVYIIQVNGTWYIEVLESDFPLNYLWDLV